VPHHTLCTFNVNNLFVRYRFGATFPGDVSGKSAVTNPAQGYLPMYDPDLFELFNPIQRELAATAIRRDGTILPDIVCLQEVESLIALRAFNERHLESTYRYALLIDSRDFRQIDVAILSRLPILDVQTHVDDLDPLPDDPKRPWLFSRDCLEVEFALGTRRLTVFLNHLKSKFAKTAEERATGDALRTRQAAAVRDLLHKRFPGSRFQSAWFCVVGDLNDEPLSAPVKPLADESGLVNALERRPEDDRWTHWYRSENGVGQLDYLLLSPALAAATEGSVPEIERRGLSFARILADGGIGPKVTHLQRFDGDPAPTDVDFRFERFDGVTPEAYASDHCPVFLEIP
jgi:endonuclease/exonuclease/phosphatase family metal-dependent hydrolase